MWKKLKFKILMRTRANIYNVQYLMNKGISLLIMKLMITLIIFLIWTFPMRIIYKVREKKTMRGGYRQTQRKQSKRERGREKSKERERERV